MYIYFTLQLNKPRLTCVFQQCTNRRIKYSIELYKATMKMCQQHACVDVIFNVVIQQQTANQRKPTMHLVFYLLIRIHEDSDKPFLKETVAFTKN